MNYSPKEVRIENSTICNYECIFCPHSLSFFNRKKEIMSNELFDHIINEVKKVPSIKECSISGMGESFLDPDILYKQERLIRESYKTHVLTNGTMTNEQFDYLYNLGIEDIRISIHSLKKRKFEVLTGRDKLDKVKELIDYIISVDSNKLILTVDTVDEKEIPDFIRKYSDKVKNLEIWKPHNWISTFHFREGPVILNTCGRPFNGPLQIQIDGTVIMCCFDYNGCNLLGDLKTQTIEEIFSSKPYLDLVEAHESGKLYGYVCESCDQRKSKGGVVIYNKMFDEEERVNLTSTGYHDYNINGSK